ncbi:MAG: TRC40/GET3/ArsA family transport-energizing ATPase [Desulfobacteraceae bacterium]|nr:TRC40/GET3/ArsA family transport-energizing ATPase [Desulfobacteraceae bacterium]
MRIIFFAGKGGVGKTSVAAATGIKAAEAGHKTVIMSLDVAHSLSDIFDLNNKSLIDQDRGSLTKIRKNLWIQELDIQEEIEKNWGDIHKYLSTLLNTTGLDEILAEELAILPGMEEVSMLLHINRYVRTKKFDVILLDCAPTGESLRFISIPTTLDWYMKKIFKIERTIVRYARPLAKRLSDVPLPGEDYFEAIEFLFERLRGVDEILVDPKITTVRLITNPEKIVLKETQRAFMYFSLYKMSIDAIIMNRVLPDSISEAYFKDWRKSQKDYIKKAETYFSPIPLFPVNLFKGEVLGFDSLKALADQIYKERNPLERFFDGEPYSFFKTNGKYQLRVKLPFIGKGDVDLNKISDELIIRVGSFKRHVMLPRQVAASNSVTAKLDGEYLSVHFES